MIKNLNQPNKTFLVVVLHFCISEFPFCLELIGGGGLIELSNFLFVLGSKIITDGD